MKNEFSQTPFEIEITQDGSPTLKFKDGGESMHHSGGAATETRYIYKKPIEWALKHIESPKTCVVGLGLGYIEISWAQACLDFGKLDLPIESFETVVELKNKFSFWLNHQEENIYDSICRALDLQRPKLINEVKSIILKNLNIKNDLRTDYSRETSYSIVCFDAFSTKTSQELWTEEFLNKFLREACHEDCVFTTYACTGVLKRVLKQNGFEMIPRLGFKGKRDSTLAVRGKLKDVATTYQIS